MPKVKLNPLFAGISGTMGDLVFKRNKNGTTYVARRPRKSNAKPSPAQKKQQQKMKAAHAYATVAMQDPELRAYYEQMVAAMKSDSHPRQLAVTDYLQGNDLPLQRSGEQQK